MVIERIEADGGCSGVIQRRLCLEPFMPLHDATYLEDEDDFVVDQLEPETIPRGRRDGGGDPDPPPPFPTPDGGGTIDAPASGDIEPIDPNPGFPSPDGGDPPEAPGGGGFDGFAVSVAIL